MKITVSEVDPRDALIIGIITDLMNAYPEHPVMQLESACRVLCALAANTHDVDKEVLLGNVDRQYDIMAARKWPFNK